MREHHLLARSASFVRGAFKIEWSHGFIGIGGNSTLEEKSSDTTTY
jgi:hypothetical protein